MELDQRSTGATIAIMAPPTTQDGTNLLQLVTQHNLNFNMQTEILPISTRCQACKGENPVTLRSNQPTSKKPYLIIIKQDKNLKIRQLQKLDKNNYLRQYHPS